MALILLLVWSALPSCVIAQTSADKEYKVAAHIHSHFSHGSAEPIGNIAAYAEQRGMDALLLTDTALAEWSIGLSYLGGLFEYRQKQDSILKAGPEAYLREIEQASQAHPSVLLIPGTEPAAYYRWSGRPWSRLILHDWHRHMLLIGLHRPEDYKNLPILGNRRTYAFCWWSLWPVVILGLAYCGRQAGLPILPKLLFIIGTILLIGAIPFRCFPWNQYQPATSWAPYQALAQYGIAHGALVVLAHPESPNWDQPAPVSNRVSVQTDRYPEGLKEIQDLDGFGVFMEGNNTMSDPGGAWDQALGDYCSDRRTKPPWGFAELDYKGWGLMDTYIDSAFMVVRAQSKTEPEILNALRNGKFYSVMRAKTGPLALSEWHASASGKTVGSGETLTTHEPIRITIALSREGMPHVRARLRLIRSGKAIVDEYRNLPAQWTLQDTPPTPCAVYRVMVRDDENGYLASNPIFIRANPAPSR